MLLTHFISLNYKSCRYVEITLKDNRPTVLIGENDCGKTSILTAINYLLDSSLKKSINYLSETSERSDLSHTPLSTKEINEILQKSHIPTLLPVENMENDCSHQIVFAGKFLIESCDIDNEESKSSEQLKWLLESSSNTSDQSFWVVRLFNAKDGTGATYYLQLHATDPELADIYSCTEAKAKSLGAKFNPQWKNLNNDNGVGKSSIYERIRSILLTNETLPSWVIVPEKRWKSDLTLFPDYKYLDWKGSLDGILEATSEILKEAIKEEIQQAQEAVNKLKKSAQEKIDAQIAAFGIHNEVSVIEEIIANINFDVKPTLTELLVKKNGTSNTIHIDDQGEGIKRQIWFALLKYRSQQHTNITNKKRYLWCFDEPETHLHPKAQRNFFKTLQHLSQKNFQVMISTHSTTFVDASRISEIHSFEKSNHYTKIGSVQSAQDIHKTLGLKNSDFLFFDKFLIVEGDTEQELLPLLYELHTGNTLSSQHIKIINLGGSKKYEHTNLALQELLNGYSKLSDTAIYLMDSDTKLKKNEFTFLVGKQDLEDAIPTTVWCSIIREVFDTTIHIDESDIQTIIDRIPATSPNSPALSKNDKFAEKLRALVQNKLAEVNRDAEKWKFRPKGKEWGELIARHITSASQIPKPILAAFDRLNNE